MPRTGEGSPTWICPANKLDKCSENLRISKFCLDDIGYALLDCLLCSSCNLWCNLFWVIPIRFLTLQLLSKGSGFEEIVQVSHSDWFWFIKVVFPVKSLFLELQILPSCNFTRADVSGRTASCFCCEELLELTISVGIHDWLFGNFQWCRIQLHQCMTIIYSQLQCTKKGIIVCNCYKSLDNSVWKVEYLSQQVISDVTIHLQYL